MKLLAENPSGALKSFGIFLFTTCVICFVNQLITPSWKNKLRIRIKVFKKLGF